MHIFYFGNYMVPDRRLLFPGLSAMENKVKTRPVNQPGRLTGAGGVILGRAGWMPRIPSARRLDDVEFCS